MSDQKMVTEKVDLSPPQRKFIQREFSFQTPVKFNNSFLEKKILDDKDIESPSSHCENIFTPNQLLLPSTQSANQTTNQSPFYQSPIQNWRTPVTLLKTNPFLVVSDHSTPIVNFSENAKREQHTPVSPYSDRYIPFRQKNVSRNLFQVQNQDRIFPFELGQSQQSQQNIKNVFQSMDEEERQQKAKNYQALLQENILEIKQEEYEDGSHNKQCILQFKNPQENSFSFLSSEKKIKKQKNRKIEQAPVKVLDAPGLLDDFYQDVLHWSKTNLIAVGLTQTVYLYNVNNGKVLGLADSHSDPIQYTSLQWNQSGTFLAMGNYNGGVMLWDARAQQICSKRIGTISWANHNVFACGSKDKSITIADLRVQGLVVNKFQNAHTQEICSITFSDNEHMLASGGNDNKVHIWSLLAGLSNNMNSETTDHNKHYLQWTIKDHKAAIRALAWNPHANGVIASGGGNSDKTIRTFSTTTNTPVQTIEVDSQVCKIVFSRNSSEFVSTHGYERNQIIVWQYPQMKRISCLEGHTERVLYASISPDETSLVSGSGDETLKFWNIFPKQTFKEKQEEFKITDFR